jgi:hypothetical protein
MNDPQQTFRRLAQQLQRSGGGGGRPPPGLIGGTGLLVALVGGGLLLNASLFNGACASMDEVCNLLNSDLVDGGHRAIKYTR